MYTRQLLPLVALVALAACAEQPTTPKVEQPLLGSQEGPSLKKDKAGKAALLTEVPVAGSLIGGGTFAGTMSVTHIDYDETTRKFLIDGVLNGTATTPAGAVQVVNAKFEDGASRLGRASATTASATSPSMVHMASSSAATCDILFLDLGPLNLDLLGLTLDLAEVILDLNAVTGSGNLLGNLLCAVTGLLDGVGFLASIGQLLDSINNILDGLSGLLGVQFIDPSAAIAPTFQT
jgi:hypothetical protein